MCSVALRSILCHPLGVVVARIPKAVREGKHKCLSSLCQSDSHGQSQITVVGDYRSAWVQGTELLWLLFFTKNLLHASYPSQLPSWRNPHGPLSWLAGSSFQNLWDMGSDERAGRVMIQPFPDPNKSWSLLDGHVPSTLIWEALHSAIVGTYGANGSAGTDLHSSPTLL